MVVARLDALLLDCHVGLRPPRNDGLLSSRGCRPWRSRRAWG